MNGETENAANIPTSGRIGGIDFGTVRIGVAICDPGQSLASPLENYPRKTPELDARFFRTLAEQERLVGWVVGLPLHLSGDESEKSGEAREFAGWLQKLTQLPIAFQDERYTSSIAEDALLAANLTKKQRKARMDKLAAQLILMSFLDRRKQGLC